MKPIIGILAGMGPKSTAPFLDLVISICQSQLSLENDIDFPHILIYSLPTPFYPDRPIDDGAMKKAIIGGLKKLESSGVSFISMPCNSACMYFETLKSSISIPLLNIIDITAKNLHIQNKRTAILATRSTLKANLYQNAIKEQGHDFVDISDLQDTIDQLIVSIKQKDSNPQKFWNLISEELEKQSVKSLIIACTDLTDFFSSIKCNFSMIDSSVCLARETVMKWNALVSV